MLYQNAATPIPRRTSPVSLAYSLTFAVVVDVLLTLFQTLAEGVVVVGVAGEAVVEALGHDVLHAVLQRIHVYRTGALVDVGIIGKGGLRHTVAPHGAGGGLVGEHGEASSSMLSQG